jgi:hypothetical protein
MSYEREAEEFLESARFKMKFRGVSYLYDVRPDSQNEERYWKFRRALDERQMFARSGGKPDVFELAKEHGMNEVFADGFARAAGSRQLRDFLLFCVTAGVNYISNQRGFNSHNDEVNFVTAGLMILSAGDYAWAYGVRKLFEAGMGRRER